MSGSWWANLQPCWCWAYVGLHWAIHLGVELILACCKNLTQPQCTQFVGSNSGCANGRGSLLPRLPTLTHTINLDSPNPRRCGTASWQLKWSFFFFFFFLVNLGMPSSLDWKWKMGLCYNATICETHGAAGKRHCLWVPLFWWAIPAIQTCKDDALLALPWSYDSRTTVHNT